MILPRKASAVLTPRSRGGKILRRQNIPCTDIAVVSPLAFNQAPRLGRSLRARRHRSAGTTARRTLIIGVRSFVSGTHVGLLEVCLIPGLMARKIGTRYRALSLARTGFEGIEPRHIFLDTRQGGVYNFRG